MKAPSGGSARDAAARREHDRHDHRVVVLVLSSLAALAYLWSDWVARFPLPGLERARELPLLGLGFEGGRLAQEIWIAPTPTSWGGQSERLLLLATTAVAFLFSYYLPVERKKPPLVVATLFLLGLVLGGGTLSILLACHLVVYAALHGPAAGSRPAAVGSLALATLVWLPVDASPWLVAAAVAVSAPVLFVVYGGILVPVLASKLGKRVQSCIAHSSVLVLGAAVAWNALTGARLPHIFGLFIFFWQWERLIMYEIDFRHGRIPAGLSLWNYLATFFTPAFLANFNWIVTIGKGYDYLEKSFLARDKNRIVLSGLSLIASSVVFFALRRPALTVLSSGFELFQVPTFRSFDAMLDVVASGRALGAPSVWSGLLYEFFSFYLMWTGVAHFKVGLWRLFGYDLEPYFQKPFRATNLLELWRRYAYYYREFLLKAFYYPFFFRFFRSHPRLRVFAATLFAIGFGHFVYGHMVDTFLIDGGPTAAGFLTQLRTTPYYLMFGATLGLTAVWIQTRGRRRRKPWTWGRGLGLEVLATAGTFATFILLRMFRPSLESYDFSTCARLALAALGL